MKIGQKLTLGFIAIAFLTGIVGNLCIFQTKVLQNITKEEVYRSIEHLDDVWSLMETQEHMEIAANNYFFLGEGFSKARADYFYEKERMEKIYRKYNKEACAHVKPKKKKYHENMKLFNDKIEEALELRSQGAEIGVIADKVRNANKFAEIAHEEALELIIEHVHRDHIEPAKQAIGKAINRTITIIIITSTIAMILAISLGVFISHAISTPITNLKNAAAKIGKGNLGVKIDIKSKDEIGSLAQSFNKMTEDLKNTQTMLIRAEKLSATGRLGAGVAHELNSPISGILSLIRSYMKEENPNSEEYQDLKRIEDTCNYMAKIVNEFSAFTKENIEKHKKLDCSKIIEDTLIFMSHQLKKKYIRVEKDYEKSLPLIRGDKNQLQQIIANMITNARDAISRGGIFKVATRTVIVNEKRFVEMEFSDTGRGIGKENIKNIFDPFFTTKRLSGGIGLGLSIAYKIIEAHNGKIMVNSIVGKGTNFIIRLPVVEEAARNNKGRQ